ncbi:tRNA adenosine deaminase-associated protein [Nocardioides panacisoli]|uniref:tRNA adenosine deaminase-associated protein n=1 Tax=Nocardioides panacisoli TaxID=627624 RepID=UPI001C639660|nr:tRNA adenosine deaminase-associated protein [Nocardioides panacisoli]QYJ03006.1 tRNA adenosine deaminase-associated protein [Nocardioides panacisoli]
MAGPEAIDFAVAAYREEGVWQVAELTLDHVVDVDTLADALRRFPGDHGSVGLVAVDEDFFLIVHVVGQRARVLLSDITAATEWEIAASAVEFLGLPTPDDEDDEPEPAGELDLLDDLGVGAMDLGMLLDDPDYYPDELLSEVARRIGFGEAFDEVVGLTSA